MKQRGLKQVNRGQIVEARIIEKVSPTEFIVTFDGDLVRVSNKSQKKFDIGQNIRLVVTSVNPLTFQLAKSSNGRSLNLSV